MMSQLPILLLLVDISNDGLWNKIAEATEKTATNTTSDYIDYISFTVAILALFVALITLIYTVRTLSVSKRTLASQERTEKNTRKISYDAQSELLGALAAEVYSAFARMCALYLHLQQHQFTNYPSKQTIAKLKLPLSYVQEESNVNEDNNAYIDLVRLKETMADYNNMLPVLFKIVEDKDGVIEAKQDALEEIMINLIGLIARVSKLFRDYYAGTEADTNDRIIELPYADINDAATYPILDDILIEGKSSLNVLCKSFLTELIKERDFVLPNGKPITVDMFLYHLAQVIAEYLISIKKEFYNYPLPLNEPYICNWSGILLPTPSAYCKDMFEYGNISLYCIKEELRLYRNKVDIEGAKLTLYNDEVRGQVSIPFTEIKDEKGIWARYYAINNPNLASIIAECNRIVISVEPTKIPLIVEAEHSDVASLYTYEMTSEEFNKKIYLKRVTESQFKQVDLMMNSLYPDSALQDENSEADNKNDVSTTDSMQTYKISDEGFEFRQNSDGNIILMIRQFDTEPDSPVLLIDYEARALLVRNKISALEMSAISDENFATIANQPDIEVGEVDGEAIVKRYFARVVVVKSIDMVK